MPAVNPTRMRFQVEALMAHYANPETFHLALTDLFELYANHALRFGDAVGIRPMIPIYHLPAPLIRQLEVDLERMVADDPQTALALADELWQDAYYEVKRVAITVLGLYPLEDPQPVLDRLDQWITSQLDLSLLPKIFSSGTRQLQTQYPEVWEEYLETFLQSEDPQRASVGFLGLAEGLNNPQFNNLPALFRLVGPHVREPQAQTLKSLTTLVRALANVSPTETGYFIKQVLSVALSPELKRLVKDSLSAFPPEVQEELKPFLTRQK
jgi:hypothetical protein